MIALQLILMGGIRGVKNELRHKMLLQVSVHELHIEILKIYATGFSMAYDEKGLVYVSDSALLLIPPKKLRNMAQRHKIICG